MQRPGKARLVWGIILGVIALTSWFDVIFGGSNKFFYILVAIVTTIASFILLNKYKKAVETYRDFYTTTPCRNQNINDTKKEYKNIGEEIEDMFKRNKEEQVKKAEEIKANAEKYQKIRQQNAPDIINQTFCPYCGAAVTGEVCEFCGMKIED